MRVATILCGVFFCTVAGAQTTAPPLSADSETDLSKLGYDLEGRLVVHATINGRPVILAADTGADGFVLFPAAAERLGVKTHLRPQTQPAGPDEPPARLTEPCELRIESVLVGERVVFGVPYVLPGVKVGLDGLIGWPSLRDNVWIFDGDNGNLTRSADLPDVAGWQKYRLRPATTLQLQSPLSDGTGGVILVDTGSPDGVKLSTERWKRWTAAHADQPSTMVAFVMMGTGVIVHQVFWAGQLDLGALHLTDVPVEEATDREMTMAPNHAATLGMYALRRCKLAVDGRNSVAYIKPSSVPPAPFNHNRLGAVFVPKDLTSDPLIAHVAKGSPAEEAGIRDGDILKKIESLDVTAWRTTPGIMPLSRFFERAAGTKRNFTLERDGHELRVSAVYRDILAPAARSPAPSATHPAGSTP